LDVIITGAAGFIGSKLTQLLARDHNIIALDDFSGGTIERIGGTRVHQCDVTDPDQLKSALRVAHEGALAWDGLTLVHCAAIPGVVKCEESPALAVRNNLMSLKTCLSVLRPAGLKKVIFPSSIAVYGDTFADPIPRTLPLNWYGVLKVACEKLLHAEWLAKKVKYHILRQTNVYGRSLAVKDSLINRFCRMARDGQALTVMGKGDATRDFIHIQDLCWVYRRLLTYDECLTMNVGSGRCASVMDVADKVGLHSPKTVRVVTKRKRLAGKREPKHVKVDIGKLTRLLDFRPQWTLDEGIKDLLEGELA